MIGDLPSKRCDTSKNGVEHSGLLCIFGVFLLCSSPRQPYIRRGRRCRKRRQILSRLCLTRSLTSNIDAIHAETETDSSGGIGTPSTTPSFPPRRLRSHIPAWFPGTRAAFHRAPDSKPAASPLSAPPPPPSALYPPSCSGYPCPRATPRFRVYVCVCAFLTEPLPASLP